MVRKTVTAAFLAEILTIAVLMATVLLAFTLSVAALAEDDEDGEILEARYVMCRPKSCVFVRRAPKKTAEIVGRLECGDKIYVRLKKKRCYLQAAELTMEDADGWIHAGYLVDEKPEVYPDGKEYTVAAHGRVALRRYVNGPRRRWIRPGKTLTVYAMTKTWALTNRGFIMTEFLEEVKAE